MNDTTANGFSTGLVQPDNVAAPEPKGLFERVLDLFSTEENRLQQEQEALARKIADADQARMAHKSLLKSCDQAASRLGIADEQFSNAKARREALSQALASSWGISPETMPNGPTYTALVALDAALAAFPEARRLIADELAVARKQVKDFERAHSATNPML